MTRLPQLRMRYVLDIQCILTFTHIHVCTVHTTHAHTHIQKNMVVKTSLISFSLWNSGVSEKCFYRLNEEFGVRISMVRCFIFHCQSPGLNQCVEVPIVRVSMLLNMFAFKSCMSCLHVPLVVADMIKNNLYFVDLQKLTIKLVVIGDFNNSSSNTNQL